MVEGKGGPPWSFPGGKRYRSLGSHLRELFGCRVQKVTLDAGFSCPNRDGLKGKEGCLYCNNMAFSPANRRRGRKLEAQLGEGIELARKRLGAEKFIAYFQPYSNTYGELPRLRAAYDVVLGFPEVVGLSIGTRPDCVPDPVLELIRSYTTRYYVCAEFGLQSCHDETLRLINRGHTFSDFEDAVVRARGKGIRICAHIILGLPGEGPREMMETARRLAALPVGGIKIHPLHVVKDSSLEMLYRAGGVKLLEGEEYVELVCDFLELMPQGMVVERLTGEAPREMLLSPLWCLDKGGLLEAIDLELERRGSYQGRRFSREGAALSSCGG